MDVLALIGSMIQSDHHSYPVPTPSPLHLVATAFPAKWRDARMRAGLWSGQQEPRAKQMPLTAFYFNSGLFLIFFRSENYSSDPLERLVYFFPGSSAWVGDGYPKLFTFFPDAFSSELTPQGAAQWDPSLTLGHLCANLN